jgi:hypothetical protein
MFWNNKEGWVYSFSDATKYNNYFDIDLPSGGRIISEINALSEITDLDPFRDFLNMLGI